MKRVALVLLIVGAVVGIVAPAFAGPGIHAGLSLTPDDFVIGFHFQKPLDNPQLVLVPSIEAGFGDVTMIAGNLDLHYVFHSSSNLKPYAGGGITLNWFDNEGGSSTDFGGSILGGINLSPKFYFETKVGLGDVPDWKFLVGVHRP